MSRLRSTGAGEERRRAEVLKFRSVDLEIGWQRLADYDLRRIKEVQKVALFHRRLMLSFVLEATIDSTGFIRGFRVFTPRSNKAFDFR